MIGIMAIITLVWVAPIENVDGSELTNLASYRIYYGTSSRSYDEMIEVDDPLLTTWQFCAAVGDYYFAMTALDSEGNESAYSNEVLKTEDGDCDTGPVEPLVFSFAQDGSVEFSGDVHIGETGAEVMVTWQSTQSIQLRLVPYAGQAEVLVGLSTTGEWRFTPTRAGLYQLLLSTDTGATWAPMTTIFYFKLAAPTPGGID